MSGDHAPMELDDTAISAIVEALVGNEAFVAAVADKVKGASAGESRTLAQETDARLAAVRGELAGMIDALGKRLAQLEKPEAERQREWQQDLPRGRATRVTYRPREAHATTQPAPGTPAQERGDLAAIAEGTLSRMKKSKGAA